MKILYFGTICDIKKYEERLINCKYIPSKAPIIFETALLSGLKENCIAMDIYSFPMIPSFPSSNILYLRGIKEKLSFGYDCTWLKTINVPLLKQISRSISAKRIIKKWIKQNKYEKDKVIISYSIPPFLVKNVIKARDKYGAKAFAIVPDLPRDMFVSYAQKGIKAFLRQAYLSYTIKRQDQYDGYVYLTDAMHNVVAPKKPYIVVEGIAQEKANLSSENSEKTSKSIMYAGMLNVKYGIINLLDAFEQIDNKTVELWLFGDGDAVPEIKSRATNNIRIKYYGAVAHEQVIDFENKATLLVNTRDPNELFTKYSFPSKTIEYMMSGTPVLTTKLSGIPEEYFEYLFVSSSNSTADLCDAINKILSIPNTELDEIGNKARLFLATNKNAKTQSKRIIEFMEGVCHD